MKSIRLVVLVVAVALGLMATYFGRTIIERSRTVVAAPTSQVVVAVATLDFGTVLTPENLKEIAWPSGATPEGAFASKADLLKDGRRVVLSSLQRNEPVLSAKVSGANGRASLAALLDPGMRAVTIRVDDVRGVAGFVRPSDRVDILLTQTSDGKASADVLLKNVKVLAVDQIANERQEGPTVAKAVTIEVATEHAQKLVLAQGVGSLSLILRQPDGFGDVETRRVTLADLGQSGDGRDDADRIASLEDQIAQMRALAGSAGQKDRQDLLNRIAQLEGRLSSELTRLSARSVDKIEPAPVLTDTSLVRVTRGGKPEEYNVQREGGTALVRSGR